MLKILLRLLTDQVCVVLSADKHFSLALGHSLLFPRVISLNNKIQWNEM